MEKDKREKVDGLSALGHVLTQENYEVWNYWTSEVSVNIVEELD